MRVRFFMPALKHGHSGHQIGRKKHVRAARAAILRQYAGPAVYVRSWLDGDMRGFEFEVGKRR